MTTVTSTATDKETSASSVRRWLNPVAHWIAFAAGIVLIVAATHVAWKDIGIHFEAAFSALLKNEKVSFKYNCARMECERCLAGVEKHPDGLVITGASGAIWGIDLTLLQRATQRPIIDCTMTGTSMAVYESLFTVEKLKPDQVVLNFVNSWEPLGQWGKGMGSVLFAPLPQRVEAPPPSLFDVYLNRLRYSVSWFQNTFRILQVKLRNWLILTYPQHSKAIEFFPLDEKKHVEGKARLMERSILISPYFGAFIQSYTLPSREEMRDRLQSFRTSLSPVSRQLYVNVPEYTPITNAQNHEFYAKLKTLFIEGVKAIGSEYVDVDYDKCGLTVHDFWKGGGSGGFDAIHLAPGPAKTRMTECLMKELTAYGSLR